MEDMNSETSLALVEDDQYDPDYIKHKGCMYDYIDFKSRQNRELHIKNASFY